MFCIELDYYDRNSNENLLKKIFLEAVAQTLHAKLAVMFVPMFITKKKREIHFCTCFRTIQFYKTSPLSTIRPITQKTLMNSTPLEQKSFTTEQILR